MKERAAAHTATDGVERESTVGGPPSERRGEQYSLAKILGIWVLATVPMDILARSVFRYWHPISRQILSDQVSRGWCCSHWRGSGEWRAKSHPFSIHELPRAEILGKFWRIKSPLLATHRCNGSAYVKRSEAVSSPLEDLASWVKRKRKRIGEAFDKYAGDPSPETLEPSRFIVVQANILGAIERDLRALEW